MDPVSPSTVNRIHARIKIKHMCYNGHDIYETDRCGQDVKVSVDILRSGRTLFDIYDRVTYYTERDYAE